MAMIMTKIHDRGTKRFRVEGRIADQLWFDFFKECEKRCRTDEADIKHGFYISEIARVAPFQFG